MDPPTWRRRKSLFASDELSEALACRGTQWQFIPKRAPWFGGFWERLIGLTKSCLKKTLGRTHATMESLQTIVVEVEAHLNNRPLTYSSSDIGDPEPITPSHLLHGRRITTLPHTRVEIKDPDFGDASAVKHRARVHATIIKHFWSRWRNEYLTALRETHKSTGNNEQHVNVGDVVLVHNDSTRVHWRLAVIESLNKGADGLVRSANIRTATGRTNRPIARLYPLEVTAATEATAKSVPPEKTSEIPIEDHFKRPVREAARRGKENIKQWTTTLRAPPQRMSRTVINYDVTNCNCSSSILIVGSVRCSCCYLIRVGTRVCVYQNKVTTTVALHIIVDAVTRIPFPQVTTLLYCQG